MLFSFFKNRRRKKLRAEGLPRGLHSELPHVLWQYAALSGLEQKKLASDAAVLFSEKNWEGCGGLGIDDQVRLTISSQIALMTLGLGEEYFDRVLSVLVYPDAYRAPEKFMRGGGVVVERESTRLGEAWHRGPVILSWADVVEAGQGPNDGRHIVAHEFSHQLDMLNGGDADGVPLMRSRQQAERWLRVLDAALRQLRRDCRRGGDPMLDCYGASNRSELFAVASEAFFQTPEQIAQRDQDLFDVMREYYGVDPLEWLAGTAED